MHASWSTEGPRSTSAVADYQDLIPVYDALPDDNELHDQLFDGPGCFVVRRVFDAETMDRLNRWTDATLEATASDPNATHPLQPDKRLINRLLERMAESDPELLAELLES